MTNEMDEFDRIEAEWEAKHPNWRRDAEEDDEDGAQLPFYPLSPSQQYPLAQVPPTGPATASEPVLTRRIGPLPVWGWALLTVVGGGVGYYFYSQKDEKKVTRNRGSSNEGMGDDAEPSTGFRTSRSEFADKLHGHLRKNGMAEKVTIYRDADEAKKKLKQVSPLVTIKCQMRPPLKELDRFAKREGLTAIEHDDNAVGCYPRGGNKGKAWEDYTDALRDDGQEV